MQQRYLWLIFALSVAGLSAFVLSECTRAPKAESTAIGIATWPGFAPSFLARERHYFGDLKVKIDVLDDFSARRSAFVSGQDSFTIYTIDSLAFDAGKGVDGQIVLVLDESHGADGIVTHSAIKSAADLRGKTIAYTRGSPSHFFLVKYLKAARLSIADVHSVQVDDPTRAAQAFMSGTVDAAVTWEPFLSQITQRHLGVVAANSATMPDQIVDVLVASRSMVRDHPDIVKRVVSGWLEALDEVKHPRSDTVTIMAKGLNMSVKDFGGSASGVEFADRQINQIWLAPAGGTSRGEALFDEASQVWRSEKISASPSSALPYFFPEFALATKGQ